MGSSRVFNRDQFALIAQDFQLLFCEAKAHPHCGQLVAQKSFHVEVLWEGRTYRDILSCQDGQVEGCHGVRLNSWTE